MVDVRQWLESIGCGDYANAFEENAIEADLLADLTDDDLQALGVVALGHRKRILKSIAEVEIFPAESETFATGERPTGEAERRQLTVMFCDLVDSTALTQRLGAEDFRELLVVYQSAARCAIERFGGYIARYMGDGLLVYFGFPQAHEDDAERAVRAGLAISRSVAALESPAGVTLAVRIGIATGPVVVGDIVGEGASEESVVLGDTPNLAARLQGSARPGSVVIADETFQLVHGLFECSVRGVATYKGFKEPLQSWLVEDERTGVTRFEARQGRVLAPLVGRQSDLSLLLDRWEQARDGDGQVVVLCGEPGIGKSRLTQELREQVGQGATRVLRYQCSPYHAQSAFYPIITALGREMGFSGSDSDADRLDKLQAMLARDRSAVDRVLPLFAALLSVPMENEPRSVDLGERHERRRLMDALVDQFLKIAANAPVLSIFEDAHWMDPSTIETVTSLIDGIQDARAMLIITCRPEFKAPWINHHHVSLHSLKRLGQRHRLAMIDGLSGGKALPSEVVQVVLSRTDGVPLYVEELMRSVLQGGHMLEFDDRFELHGDLSNVGIPTTLQDSLVARLDQMGKAKDIAQLCATIGRESSLALLRLVSSLDEPALDSSLERLVEAGVLIRQRRVDGTTFVFEHALLQDAAYESLLRATRQRLHKLIAGAIEQHFPSVVEVEPEVLAHHHTQAGQAAQAVDYWRRAGLRARARSANRETVEHATKALLRLSELSETSARDRDELELQMLLGAATVATEGFTSQSVERIYQRALALGENLRAVPEACQALRGLQICELMRGKVAQSRHFAEELLRLAENAPDGAYAVGGHHALGQTLFLSGEFIEARNILEAGVERFDASPHRLSNWPGGQPGGQCHIYLALTLWMLGFPERAQAHMDKALEHAEKAAEADSAGGAEAFTLANTETFVAMLSLLRRDAARVLAHSERGLSVSDEYMFIVFQNSSRILRGAGHLLDGDPVAGRREIRVGLQALESTGLLIWHPLWLSPLSDPVLNPAPFDDDLAMASVTATRARADGYLFFDAELQRWDGERVRALDPGKAEAQLREALAVARRQSAKALELRAAKSLASLLLSQGRREVARDILGPVLAWFTEGFHTPDLEDAQRLLDELK